MVFPTSRVRYFFSGRRHDAEISAKVCGHLRYKEESMKEHIIKFDTPDDWRPLEPACWDGCPFACLTKLGEECQARKAYRSDGLMICPAVRYGGILGKYEGTELYTDKGREGMTCKEAARLIDPDTCTEALEEYKRHGEEVAFKAMEEALSLACKALERMS